MSQLPINEMTLNPRLAELARNTRSGAHHRYRKDVAMNLADECRRENLSWPRRVSRLIIRMCQAETPIVMPDDRIAFTRTITTIPRIWDAEEWATLTDGRTLHELGPISNVCADWSLLLDGGLLARKRAAKETLSRMADDPDACEFLRAAIESIDAMLELAHRYANAARHAGNHELADIFEHVPAHRPKNFHAALQSLRFCHAIMWMGGNYHIGLGRFDQYMWPFLHADLNAGRIQECEALELLEEFYISLNRDSDLYPGVQQGDNGQTVMLGGVRPDGASAVNPLTEMCLKAALAVRMIDPKINLRIDQHTDLKLLELAAQLTRVGMGFPQYSNDDVVIPALVAQGYSLEDARDYSVAACWEFLIPGRGMEVLNIGAVSLPAAVDAAIRQGLERQESFDAILRHIRDCIDEQVKIVWDRYSKLILPPAPHFSVFMRDCLETGRDMSCGLRYNNFGIHGAGAASAADALAAVHAEIFEEKTTVPSELLAALAADFRGYDALRNRLISRPKAGNHDDRADDFLVTLFHQLANSCAKMGRNNRGGTLRPGSGSAMYYLWLARHHDGMCEPVVGATADGRRNGDAFGANLAPRPGIQSSGPMSILQSFSKIPFNRICNGGPITLELSDSVFRSDEGISKVALLIRCFAHLGGQQLQLNTLNAKILKDAKIHPDQYRNLVVRVWGWSGYFCELEEPYQDHIISRQMCTFETE